MQRNFYWAHPEAVLLTMVADQDPEVRARAVQAIQRYRQQFHDPEVREYKLAYVDFAASDLTLNLTLRLSAEMQHRTDHLAAPHHEPQRRGDRQHPELAAGGERLPRPNGAGGGITNREDCDGGGCYGGQ